MTRKPVQNDLMDEVLRLRSEVRRLRRALREVTMSPSPWDIASAALAPRRRKKP